jgi:hypothetical protein
MNQKDHIKADLLLLGYSIMPVHKIIDDLVALKQYGPSHRIYGHNKDFLFWLKDSYGKSVYQIALLHILIDLDILERKELKKILEDI